MKQTLAEHVLDFVQATKLILAWLTLIVVVALALGVPQAIHALPVVATPLALLALARNPVAKWTRRSLVAQLAEEERERPRS